MLGEPVGRTQAAAAPEWVNLRNLRNNLAQAGLVNAATPTKEPAATTTKKTPKTTPTCKRGHALTDDNVIVWNSRRQRAPPQGLLPAQAGGAGRARKARRAAEQTAATEAAAKAARAKGGG